MALHMDEGHAVQSGLIEQLPEIAVQHWTPGSGPPALAFPALNPLAEAINQIFAVGTNRQVGMARQGLEGLQ